MLAFWLRAKMFWAMRRNTVRVGRLFLDQRVPPLLKISAALGGLLIISPIDLFGDIPGLGILDDTALLMLLGWLFVRFCPPEAVAEHFGAAPGQQLKNVTPS